MADPENKVPFPLAGEGAHLRFRTADLVTLRTKYGEPKELPDGTYERFTDRIDALIQLYDPLAILDCLKAGLKKEDGRTPLSAIHYDDLPFSLIEAAQPIRDAITLGISGTAYSVLLAAQRAKAEEEARLRARGVAFNDEDPLEDPQNASTET
jgi:hypothetical protein